jgi:hypothetical protein
LDNFGELPLFELLDNIENDRSVPFKAILIFTRVLSNADGLSLVEQALAIYLVSDYASTAREMLLPNEGLHSHVAVAPESHHLREKGFLAEKDLGLILLKEGARLCPDNVGWIE